MDSETDQFWHKAASVTFDNEGSVESRLVLPMLRALGYDESEDINPKFPIIFQEGRSGRRPEADFVVFGEQPHNRTTSLIVVEAKKFQEDLGDGKSQGESYAANIRAPVLVLTNGARLEIWQVQSLTDSECVLACEISELAAKRGAIEGLIGKPALIAHSKTLEHKSFGLMARDLSAYERAEFDRDDGKVGPAIVRRLRPQVANAGKLLGNTLLETFSDGAIIVGASGHGKTTLCRDLRRQAVERLWSGEDNRLPVEVFLPDPVRSGVTIEKFLSDRVSAHCPSVTEHAMRTRLRDDGVILLCDGFDRIAADVRAATEAALATFKRDYPRSQIFVLTGLSARPDRLGLPSVELPGYDLEEQREVVALFERLHTGAGYLHWSDAPAFLKEIGQHPVLMSLTLSAYLADKRYPTDILPLFEEWLNQIVPPSYPASRRIGMRNILTLVANETMAGPVRASEVLKLVHEKGLSEAHLDALHDREAFSIQGDTLELRHEMLADYLRSCEIMGQSIAEAALSLAALKLRQGSQLPVLLMANATNAELQKLVWSAVVSAGLSVAASALRFRADTSDETNADFIERSHRYLTDLLEGIEAPLGAYFPNLTERVRANLVGSEVRELGISGGMSMVNGGASYSFRSVLPGEDKVVIGSGVGAGRFFGKNLQLMGLRADSGRVIGLNDLKDALLSLVKQRVLNGGQIWKEELTVSRLRHLVREFGYRDLQDQPLSELNALLAPLAGHYAQSDLGGRRQEFLVDDLILDIDWLLSNGVTQLPALWERTGSLDLALEVDQETARKILDRYYRRMQLVYREIVDADFSKVASMLPFYQITPVKYDVRVRLGKGSRYHEASMDWTWMPVRTFDEAGATVTFHSEPAGKFSNDEARAHIAKIDRELARIGRIAPDTRYEWGSSGLPDFSSELLFGQDRPDETKALRSAANHIFEGIKHLFRELNTTDLGRPSPSIEEF